MINIAKIIILLGCWGNAVAFAAPEQIRSIPLPPAKLEATEPAATVNNKAAAKPTQSNKAAENKNEQGISFTSLRVIYSAEDRKGVTVSFKNNSDNAYLMQSWVQKINLETGLPENNAKIKNSEESAFIVTPPLEKLAPHSEIQLRIRQTSDALPQDRESVFFLSAKAIPAQSDRVTPASAKVVMTVVTNIKLFYRPAGLNKQAIEKASAQLRFSRSGDSLVANNPTPYWLTFASLSVDGNALEKPVLRVMVPPKGSAHYPLPANSSNAKQVEWQLIDEIAWNTPLLNQTL